MNQRDGAIRRPRDQGFSLVELMISISLGLFMMAALTTLLTYQTASRDEFDKASRQIENGRYAMQILHDDIELAGFYGQLFDFSSYPLPSSLPDPCDLTNLASAVPLPIQGYDAPASGVVASGSWPSGSTCLPPANYLRGDVLVIRRADTGLTTIANAAAGTSTQLYMQATGSQFVINTGANANTAFTLTATTSSGTVAANLRAYQVHIYYISRCNKQDSSGNCTDSIPTLKRVELGSSGTFNNTAANPPTPLVEGIEYMQLDYGIDSDGDGYPDSYITTPANITDWSNVMAIRVNLVARNNDPSAGYRDSKTYSLGAAGTVGPFNDTFKRHAYSEVVRAVNLTGRRAQQ